MPTEDCSAMAALGAERLSEVEQERRGYLPFAAKSHMTDEELAELEETRMTAEEELAAILAARRSWRSLSGTGMPCLNPMPR
jgi:hypothetical protein